MKIAQFNTHDIKGGAAIASYRLFKSLKQLSPTYFVKYKTLQANNIINLQENPSDISLEKKLHHHYININRSNISNTLFSFSYSGVKLPDLNKFDIINLHWVEYFLSPKNLYELTLLNKPIVWTLHDMKAFTGGCHYSSTCTEYTNTCHQCKQLITDPINLPEKILHLKQEIFKNSNMTIVTPSKWLKKEAKKSSLFKDTSIKVIPNSIDSKTFKAIEKKKAKKHFNIEPNTILLSFGVMNHKETRKGYHLLIESINLIKQDLQKKKVKALFFGASENDDFPIESINLGHINNEETLNKAYCAADIFILPSIEDNLPNTILESLSCQTPVIAFDTGGAKDIINKENGILVQKANIKALSKAILKLVNDPKKRIKKGIKGRKLILDKYQPKHQAKRYKKLYNQLLQTKTHSSKHNIDFSSFSYEIIGFCESNFKENKNTLFSKNFNKFYNQVSKIPNNTILYGNGIISKTIQALVPEKIIGYVDINDKHNHPKTISNKSFNCIIITVLGREDLIIKYLTEELNINKDKIITIDLN